MRPLAYVFPYALIFWVVFIWAFVREAGVIGRAQKAASSGGAPDDKGSLRFVVLTSELLVGPWTCELLVGGGEIAHGSVREHDVSARAHIAMRWNGLSFRSLLRWRRRPTGA